MNVNQQHLKEAWDVSQVSTREEWLEWLRRLAVEFMKESPSHALRACKSLAETYSPLARELFNPAFVSCWTELFDSYQVGGFPPPRIVTYSAYLVFLGGPCTLHRARNHCPKCPSGAHSYPPQPR